MHLHLNISNTIISSVMYPITYFLNESLYYISQILLAIHGEVRQEDIDFYSLILLITSSTFWKRLISLQNLNNEVSPTITSKHISHHIHTSCVALLCGTKSQDLQPPPPEPQATEKNFQPGKRKNVGPWQGWHQNYPEYLEVNWWESNYIDKKRDILFFSPRKVSGNPATYWTALIDQPMPFIEKLEVGTEPGIYVW